MTLAADPSSTAKTTTQPSMWRDPMDELIADLDGVVAATPPPCTDQLPSFMDMQPWNTRSLRRAAADWDGVDPAAVNPTFEEEFAACRARWPRFYKQDDVTATRACPRHVRR